MYIFAAFLLLVRVDSGESIQEAAVREVHEEAGLIVKVTCCYPIFRSSNCEFARLDFFELISTSYRNLCFIFDLLDHVRERTGNRGHKSSKSGSFVCMPAKEHLSVLSLPQITGV